MHVLHGFGQRRKSSRRPRDLHIRKVSFSGSSLSSGCSLSSSSSSTISAVSTPSLQTPTASRPEIDPLASHPAFHAPPRLYERPFIRMDDAEPVFYGADNAVIDEEDYVEQDVAAQQPTEMALPPHVSPMDAADEEGNEPRDYFFATLSKRPPMPKSRWSESTIQSIQTFEDEEDDSEVTQSEDSEDETDDASVLEMRRLSRHASALKPVSINTTYTARPGLAPKRPPMRSLDSVDNFIRRGGWKRRGIVFHKDDLDNQRGEQDRNSF
ncbi:hypothetical protein FAGAP_4597 [Fusarium agapanthi]|uniref:AGC-kinase C-terminal domain-containing protein n=3 Tax=Fusarium fujikuroi species complex TaxID=171627 RepID=A0A9P5E7W9_9HYPO|nr:uncharacterized protein FSUBG_11161 [Fusarium subglutinans]KAF4499221.1 hypothetical protein FAGAP_4597 [Fusarium agapanthi]KAF5554790.1 hypothetical protein FMEXI_1768 [Fusarium mexicanum]KAF5589408.1 hypothetical protein FSUBG_11161 [Fusarium subglutinans]